MQIKISNKSGIVLKVAGKYIDEDITLIPDESLFPAPTYTVTLAHNDGYSHDTFLEWGLDCSYSVDGGKTFTTFNPEYGLDDPIVISNVSEIIFAGPVYTGPKLLLISKTLGEYDGTLEVEQDEQGSLSITEDTTLYLFLLETDTAPHG